MELKDVILSTLAELQDEPQEQKPTSRVSVVTKQKQESEPKPLYQEASIFQDEPINSSELLFLTNLKERLLVLFEGFQAPNNANIEAKVDLTLNFLEYILVNIYNRIIELEHKE